jgi:Ni/Fe-hydrogenase subunit HybB-like protein
MTTVKIAKGRSTSGTIVLGILVLLAVLGLVTGIYRFINGLGASTNLSDSYPWGLWIGFDFTLIAFSGGAFTLAAVVYIFNLKKYRPVIRPAIITGLLGYVSVMIILLTDLGRWDRFWAFIVYPNVHSPLFEISWCILLYTIVLSLEFLPFLFERLNKPKIVKTIHAISIPLVIAGITLSTLHQSTLGTLYLAMPVRLDPLWHTGLLPLLFFISSVGMGLSTVIMVSLIAGRAFNREVEMNVLEGLAKGSVWVWVVYLAFKLQQLLFGGLLDEALAFDIRSIWYLLEMVVGVILPIILYAMPKVRKSKSGLFWTSILVTVGILLNRFNATLTGQETGAQWAIQTVTETATYTPYWMEYSIQIGVLAAAAIAWYLIARHLPIFPEDIKKAH